MRRLIPWLLPIFLFPCAAETTVHYFDLHSLGTAFHARVNGFEIASTDSPGGFSHSRFITPFLVPGKNRLTVSYRADSQAAPDEAWIQIDIAKAPSDVIRTNDSPGEFAVSERIEPVAKYRIPPREGNPITLLSGEMETPESPIRFAGKGERRWACGIRFGPEGTPAGVPGKIIYTGLSETLALAEVHFLHSKEGHRVVFNGLKLSAGGGEIDFSSLTRAKGLEVPENTAFDTIWLFGFSAAGVEDVSLLALDLLPAPSTREHQKEFDIDLPHKWSWQSGADIAGINDDASVRDELTAYLKRLHAAIDTRPADEWAPFFKAKLDDLAKAMGKPAEEFRTGQLEFFKSLTAIEGWKLEPFDPSRLWFVPVNDRVVSVSYVDSEGPIVSVPLKKPGSQTPDRFTMPIFVSKIDGEWTVVR